MAGSEHTVELAVCRPLRTRRKSTKLPLWSGVTWCPCQGACWARLVADSNPAGRRPPAAVRRLAGKTVYLALGEGGEVVALLGAGAGGPLAPEPSLTDCVQPQMLPGLHKARLFPSAQGRQAVVDYGGRASDLALANLGTGAVRRLPWSGGPLSGDWGRCHTADAGDVVVAQRRQLGAASELWLWVGRPGPPPPGPAAELQGDWRQLPALPERLPLRRSAGRGSSSSASSAASVASAGVPLDWDAGALDVKFHNAEGQGAWATLARAACPVAALPGRPRLAVAVWSQSLHSAVPHHHSTQPEQQATAWQVVWLQLPKGYSGGRQPRPHSAPPAGPGPLSESTEVPAAAAGEAVLMRNNPLAGDGSPSSSLEDLDLDASISSWRRSAASAQGSAATTASAEAGDPKLRVAARMPAGRESGSSTGGSSATRAFGHRHQALLAADTIIDVHPSGQFIAVGVSVGGQEAWVAVLGADLKPLSWTRWSECIRTSPAQPDSSATPGLVDDSSAGLLRQVRWLHGPPMLAVVDRLGNLALLDARGRQQSLRWASVEAGSGGGGSGRSSPRRSLSPARLLRRLSSPQLTRPGSGRRSLSLPRPLRRTASPATMRGNPAFDGFDPALDRCLPAALWAPPARDHPAQRRFSAAAFVLPGEARPGTEQRQCLALSDGKSVVSVTVRSAALSRRPSTSSVPGLPLPQRAPRPQSEVLADDEGAGGQPKPPAGSPRWPKWGRGAALPGLVLSPTEAVSQVQRTAGAWGAGLLPGSADAALTEAAIEALQQLADGIPLSRAGAPTGRAALAESSPMGAVQLASSLASVCALVSAMAAKGFRARFPLRLLCMYALAALLQAGELAGAVWLARALQACLSSAAANSSPLAWRGAVQASHGPQAGVAVWRTLVLMTVRLQMPPDGVLSEAPKLFRPHIRAALQHAAATGGSGNGRGPTWQSTERATAEGDGSTQAIRRGLERYLCGDLASAAAALASGGPRGWLALAAVRVHHGRGTGALTLLRATFAKAVSPEESADAGDERWRAMLPMLGSKLGALMAGALKVAASGQMQRREGDGSPSPRRHSLRHALPLCFPSPAGWRMASSLSDPAGQSGLSQDVALPTLQTADALPDGVSARRLPMRSEAVRSIAEDMGAWWGAPTAAGLLMLGDRAKEWEHAEPQGVTAACKLWSQLGQWKKAAVLGVHVAEVLRQEGAPTRVVSRQMGAVEALLMTELERAQELPIRTATAAVSEIVGLCRAAAGPTSLAYGDVVDEGLSFLQAAIELVLGNSSVLAAMECATEGAGHHFHNEDAKMAFPSDSNAARSLLRAADPEGEAACAGDLAAILRATLICCGPHLGGLRESNLGCSFSRLMEQQLVASASGLTRSAVEQVGTESAVAHLMQRTLSRGSSLAALARNVALGANSTAPSATSEGGGQDSARQQQQQQQQEELSLQCVRVVQSAMQRAVRIAWAWRCRAEFSEAVALARQLANEGLLSGRASLSDEERKWGRAAAVWGAYLAVADDAHSLQDVLSEVLSRLAGLRSLDSSVLHLLEAQLTLAGGAGRLEGKLKSLRAQLERTSGGSSASLVGDLLQPAEASQSKGEEPAGSAPSKVALVSPDWGREAREFLQHVEQGLFAWEAASKSSGPRQRGEPTTAWLSDNDSIRFEDLLSSALKELLDSHATGSSTAPEVPHLAECFVHPLQAAPHPAEHGGDAKLALASLLGCGPASAVRQWESQALAVWRVERGEVPLGLDDWQVEEPSFARASLELSSSSAGGGGGSRDATLNGSVGALEHTLLDVVEETAAERRPAPWQPQRRVTEEEEGIRRAQQRSGELSLRTSPAAKRPQRYIIDEEASGEPQRPQARRSTASSGSEEAALSPRPHRQQLPRDSSHEDAAISWVLMNRSGGREVLHPPDGTTLLEADLSPVASVDAGSDPDSSLGGDPEQRGEDGVSLGWAVGAADVIARAQTAQLRYSYQPSGAPLDASVVSTLVQEHAPQALDDLLAAVASPPSVDWSLSSDSVVDASRAASAAGHRGPSDSGLASMAPLASFQRHAAPGKPLRRGQAASHSSDIDDADAATTLALGLPAPPAARPYRGAGPDTRASQRTEGSDAAVLIGSVSDYHDVLRQPARAPPPSSTAHTSPARSDRRHRRRGGTGGTASRSSLGASSAAWSAASEDNVLIGTSKLAALGAGGSDGDDTEEVSLGSPPTGTPGIRRQAAASPQQAPPVQPPSRDPQQRDDTLSDSSSFGSSLGSGSVGGVRRPGPLRRLRREAAHTAAAAPLAPPGIQLLRSDRATAAPGAVQLLGAAATAQAAPTRAATSAGGLRLMGGATRATPPRSAAPAGQLPAAQLLRPAPPGAHTTGYEKATDPPPPQAAPARPASAGVDMRRFESGRREGAARPAMGGAPSCGLRLLEPGSATGLVRLGAAVPTRSEQAAAGAQPHGDPPAGAPHASQAYAAAADMARRGSIGRANVHVGLLAGGGSGRAAAPGGQWRRPVLLGAAGGAEGAAGVSLPPPVDVALARPELREGEAWGPVPDEAPRGGGGGDGVASGSVLGPMERAMLELQAGRLHDGSGEPVAAPRWGAPRQEARSPPAGQPPAQTHKREDVDGSRRSTEAAAVGAGAGTALGVGAEGTAAVQQLVAELQMLRRALATRGGDLATPPPAGAEAEARAPGTAPAAGRGRPVAAAMARGATGGAAPGGPHRRHRAAGLSSRLHKRKDAPSPAHADALAGPRSAENGGASKRLAMTSVVGPPEEEVAPPSEVDVPREAGRAAGGATERSAAERVSSPVAPVAEGETAQEIHYHYHLGLLDGPPPYQAGAAVDSSSLPLSPGTRHRASTWHHRVVVHRREDAVADAAEDWLPPPPSMVFGDFPLPRDDYFLYSAGSGGRPALSDLPPALRRRVEAGITPPGGTSHGSDGAGLAGDSRYDTGVPTRRIGILPHSASLSTEVADAEASPATKAAMERVSAPVDKAAQPGSDASISSSASSQALSSPQTKVAVNGEHAAASPVSTDEVAETAAAEPPRSEEGARVVVAGSNTDAVDGEADGAAAHGVGTVVSEKVSEATALPTSAEPSTTPLTRVGGDGDGPKLDEVSVEVPIPAAVVPTQEPEESAGVSSHVEDDIVETPLSTERMPDVLRQQLEAHIRQALSPQQPAPVALSPQAARSHGGRPSARQPTSFRIRGEASPRLAGGELWPSDVEAIQRAFLTVADLGAADVPEHIPVVNTDYPQLHYQGGDDARRWSSATELEAGSKSGPREGGAQGGGRPLSVVDRAIKVAAAADREKQATSAATRLELQARIAADMRRASQDRMAAAARERMQADLKDIRSALEGVEELAEGLERDFYDSHRQLVNMERATERAVPAPVSPAVGDAAADAE
eukprot:jgi/Tetstr1/424376/TSEL_014936.t1